MVDYSYLDHCIYELPRLSVLVRMEALTYLALPINISINQDFCISAIERQKNKIK